MKHRVQTDIAFRDVTLIVLFGFISIVVLLLPHLKTAEEIEAGEKPPGNLTVMITWPVGWDTDVDLWVLAPGDRPVGYSNRGGIVFDLLRDDRGNIFDNYALNYEYAFTRGVPPGEYVVNLHLFGNPEGEYPVPVTVEVSLSQETPSRTVQTLLIVDEPVLLKETGEEVTVFRFRMTKDGRLVPGSVNTIPKALRT
jgi:hypothetical protein